MKISNIFNTLKQKKVTQPQKKIISFDGGGVRAIAGIVFLKIIDPNPNLIGKDCFFYPKMEQFPPFFIGKIRSENGRLQFQISS